jgi:hypothetical protein
VCFAVSSTHWRSAGFVVVIGHFLFNRPIIATGVSARCGATGVRGRGCR